MRKTTVVSKNVNFVPTNPDLPYVRKRMRIQFASYAILRDMGRHDLHMQTVHNLLGKRFLKQYFYSDTFISHLHSCKFSRFIPVQIHIVPNGKYPHSEVVVWAILLADHSITFVSLKFACRNVLVKQPVWAGALSC